MSWRGQRRASKDGIPSDLELEWQFENGQRAKAVSSELPSELHVPSLTLHERAGGATGGSGLCCFACPEPPPFAFPLSYRQPQYPVGLVISVC